MMTTDRAGEATDAIMDALEGSGLTVSEAIAILETVKFNLLVVAQEETRGMIH